MFAHSLNRSIRHRRLICAVLLTGLLAAGAGVLPASAQQPDSVEADTTAREAPSRPVASAERKSPRRALLYSLGGTAVPTAAGLLVGEEGGGLLVLLGAGLGPSVGHFYAGDVQQAWTGIGLRTAGTGLIAWGAAMELEETCLFWCSGQSTAESRPGEVPIAGGLLLFGGSLIYDVVTAPGSAREYNRAHGLSAQVTPSVGPQGEQVGLALRVSF